MKLSTKKDIGIKIKAIRQSLGKNLREFGELVDDASDSIVSRWEKGISKPNPYRLKRIAELGNKSIAYLLYNSPEEYLYFNIDIDFQKLISNDIDVDGIFVLLQSVVIDFCNTKHIDYYNNLNLLDYLELEELEELKAFANKVDYRALAAKLIQVLTEMFKIASMGDKLILKKLLSTNLYNSIVEYNETSRLPSSSFILNNGFELMTVEPYELIENKNEEDIFLFSKDLCFRYFELLSELEKGIESYAIITSHTYRIETHAEILKDLIEKSSNHKKTLYEPILHLINSLLDNTLEKMRDSYKHLLK